ncbi:MAG: hypothetical protein ACPL7J_14795, partial [Desulfomonilaceae bacterium]
LPLRPPCHGGSSEARNLAPKTKISQSPPLTSFEPGFLEMTNVDLSWLPPRLWKAPTNHMIQTSGRRKF